MKWAQVSIETSKLAEDALSYLLIEELSAGGVQIEDDVSNPDKVTLIVYFPLDDIVGERVSKIKQTLDKLRNMGLDVGKGSISIKNFDNFDWHDAWKSHFKPLPIGKRIIIYPSYEDISKFSSRDIKIQIDPGMAFGTGKHSTTILSLEMLEKTIRGGEKVLDIGTGTGILAIASAKLGAKSVFAIDIDPIAVNIAKENSKINGVANKVKVICGDLTNPIKDKYDVIVSNIFTKVLVTMPSDIKSHLNIDGYWILSGILETEKSEIESALVKEKFNISDIISHQEWIGILARMA
ncbi:MAG: 50S ribosomal protein L11 methyltransferase [bacterium]